jgi:hypothetical protein
MAICELIEDFSLVGFETLAVEVRYAPSGATSQGILIELS